MSDETLASVQINKTDGSTVRWLITDERADELVKIIVKQPTPRRHYSRENASTWKRRGPKPKIPVEGDLLDRAIKLRAEGMGKEAIARELKVPARTLGRAFDRYDSQN